MSDRGAPSSRQGAGWTRARVVFLAVSGALALAVLWWSADVLLPFVLALVLAFVLTPLVAAAEKKRVPRVIAILVVYALTFTSLYLSIAAIAPRVYDETVKLKRELPVTARAAAVSYGPRVESWVRGLMPKNDTAETDGPPPAAFEITRSADGGYSVRVGSGVEVVQEGTKHWRITPVKPERDEPFSLQKLLDAGIEETVSYVKRNALELLHVGQVIVSKLTRAIFLLFMTLMLAGYMMHTREAILSFFRSLPPVQARPSFDRLLTRVDRGLSGVVRGQLLICLVNGVLSAIGFKIFGLKYWPIMAIIAAVMSIIPIFGSILSSVPAVAVGLTQDLSTALGVLAWIIGIHQVEANFLNPKIIGTAAKIHPVLVVFALIVGEHVHGLWGALFAVPVLSIALSLFQHFRYESMPDMPPDSILPVMPIAEPPVSGANRRAPKV